MLNLTQIKKNYLPKMIAQIAIRAKFSQYHQLRADGYLADKFGDVVNVP